MDELIVLLIKGLIRMFSQPQPPARQPARRPAGAVPPSPPVINAQYRPGAKPLRRRQVRRAAIATIVAPSPAATDSPPPVPDAPAPPLKAKPVVAGPAPVSAAAVRGSLTPAALRQQIVVSEILQPPLALRHGA